MSEFIEQSMRTLKLGGMAREWRSVQYENTEQYITLVEAILKVQCVQSIRIICSRAPWSSATVPCCFCAYLNLAPPEMVSVYGKGRMSVSPSSILTNTE